MKIQAGTLLISSSFLEDPNFDKVVLFIARHNEDGALGFVINRPFGKTLNELQEYVHAVPLTLFDGGPVANDGIYFLHRRPDLISGSEALTDSIYLGGNFKAAVRHASEATLPRSDLKLFLGYCGWNANELEEEIAEGSWLLTDADSQLVFAADVATLWDKLHKKYSKEGNDPG